MKVRGYMVSIDANGRTEHHEVTVTGMEVHIHSHLYFEADFLKEWEDTAVDKVIYEKYGGCVQNADGLEVYPMWEGEA